MKANHGLVAVDVADGKVYHACFYETPPNDVDYLNLYKELHEDPDFKDDIIGREILIVPASQAVYDQLKLKVGEELDAHEWQSEDTITQMDDGTAKGTP